MECPVCLSPYSAQVTRPLFLPCGHTLCSSCVSDLVRGKPELVCPTCQVALDAEETKSLPTNFSLLSSRPQEIGEGEEAQSPGGCSLHSDKKVKFHCGNCGVDFCSRCVTLHSGERHKIEDLGLAVDRSIDSLLRQAGSLSVRIDTQKSHLESLSAQASTLQSLQSSIETAYEEAFSRLQSERLSILSLLSSTITSNSTTLSRLSSTISQHQQTLSQALSLLRNARHSVTNVSKKKEDLAQAEQLIREMEEIPEEIEGKIEVFTAEIGNFHSGIRINKEILEKEITEEEKKDEIEAKKEEIETKKGEMSGKIGGGKARSKKFEAVWWYMSDNSIWAPYAPGQSRQIEHAYQANETSVDLGRHMIDFTSRVEVNKKTGKQRKVGREIS